LLITSQLEATPTSRYQLFSKLALEAEADSRRSELLMSTEPQRKESIISKSVALYGFFACFIRLLATGLGP